MLGAGAPLMSDHPALRDGHTQHQNPFVPVPPPPRRSAPNSRAGLTDGTARGDDPYLIDEKTGRPVSRKSSDSHFGAGALAAGAGGAALGAAAMHHHNKNKEPEFDEEHAYNEPVPEKRSSLLSRKPVPAATVYPNDAVTQPDTAYPAKTSTYLANSPLYEQSGHPINTPGNPITAPVAAAYPTPSTNDDAFALNRPNRRSVDSARSRPSRDAARANAAFDQTYSRSSSDENHHSHAGTAAVLGAGALGGAALAHHHHRKSGSHSRSPHRRAEPVITSREIDNSDTSNEAQYADALPHQFHNIPHAEPTPPPEHTIARDMAAEQQQMPMHPHDAGYTYDVPPTPTTRSRRNSALGYAAPAAAAAAYTATPKSRSKSRSRSQSRSTSADRERAMYQTRLPSRSPHRASYPSDSAYPPYGQQQHSLPVQDDSAIADPVATDGKHIVGDNGYPHMGLPRRKSGGEYDHAQTGVLGPQTLGPRERSRSRGPAGAAVGGSRFPASMAGRGSTDTSDNDSTWRLSQGMPGGWQRSHSPAQRYSMDSNRISSPISPVDGGYGGQRDSVMSGSTAVGSGGRRLRLADLRREEEEKAMREGRERMSSEWVGNGGYDGYGYHHHQGVGQAM